MGNDGIDELLKNNPNLINIFKQLATNPKALAALSSGKGLPDPNKLQTVLYESLSVCCLCGKEQKTFTIGKSEVTQRICITCKNNLSSLSKQEQDEVFQKALKNKYYEQAKVKFKVQQAFWKKQIAETKNVKKKSLFQVKGEESET